MGYVHTRANSAARSISSAPTPAPGDALDEFLSDFPSVTRELAVAALELGREMVETHAAAA